MRTLLVSSLVIGTLAASPSRAHAEDRTWEAVMVGSVGVALAGGALLWHGSALIDHAEDNLCTGAYADSCGHPVPTRPSELAHYNDNGNRGDTDVKIGAAMILGGTALGVVALVEAYVVHERPEQPDKVTLAPAITPGGAGATFQLRW